MKKKYVVVLLTVLTLCVLAIVIIELTGISRSSLLGRHRDEGVKTEARMACVYGEIIPEETQTRDQIVSKMPKTTIQFYETRHSFGTVQQDKVVKHVFKFKNTGASPLMISKADVTCGCTVPNFC